jgi:RNA polymerase sigma-70 factor (ECF subfamily)
MAELPPPFDDRSFREHARFVRALAGALARDRDEADEVAARTFASAVEQRPRAGSQLRGWLARVARRALSRLRRDDARRDVHESAAARSERIDTDPADLAARTELTDRIALAFAALDEPAKSTLFRRFFDDLTPSQIAVESGVPVETVKTRLKRGLAKLRARLDERAREPGGARGTWRATALALARDGAPLLGITKAKGAVAAAVVFVVASAVTWWPVERSAHPVVESSSTSIPAAAAAATLVDERALPTADLDVAPAPVAADATRRTEEPPLPFVSGVVTDEHGVPLAGVRVVASFVVGIPSHAALMAGLRATTSPHVASTLDFARVAADTLALTGRDGRFAIGAPPDLLAGLYFVSPGRAPASCFDLSALAQENQERLITLVPGCTVRGRVVDRAGRPVPGAAVSANEAEPPAVPRLRQARPLVAEDTAPRFGTLADQWCTDADGRFELLLPCRSFRLDATAQGYVGDLEYSEGVDSEFEFALWRSQALLDVVDARTGTLVSGVRALATREDEPDYADCLFPPEGATTAIGRLFVHAPAHLVLFAEGYHSKTIQLAVDPEGEPPQERIALDPGLDAPSIEGSVRGALAAQVTLRWLAPPPRNRIEEATAAMLADFRPDASDPRQRRLATVDVGADGRFTFAGVPPGAYCLDVVASGCTPRRRVVTVPVRDVVFDLAASARLEVLVVDAAGAPCAGANVHVQTARDTRAWSRATDAEGVAVFANLPDAEFRLVAARELHDTFLDGVRSLESSTFSSHDDLTLAAGERRRVQLALVEPIPVTLHVHDVNGRSIEGANIIVSLKQAHAPDEVLRTTVRDLAGRVFETDVDGEVQIELWPSAWTFEVWADSHHFHRMFMLERGAARRIDLELADE